jgi:serine phosphatase RsbU (regulator of sigma subunit)
VLSPRRATTIVVALGLLITGAVSWTAWSLNRDNEHRLLAVQTRQAGAVLASTILSIRDPLDTALQIETATGGSGEQFSRYLANYVGPGRLFRSATLYQRDAAGARVVATQGAPTNLTSTSAEAQAFIGRAFRSPDFVVTSIQNGSSQTIGYAIADAKDPEYAVYAERAIPANRRVPVESDSAFADLDYATYLGATATASDLATTDLPPDRLPLTGDTSRVIVPFGDTSLILIASPRSQLGGTLGEALPWAFLIGGVLLTLGTAVVTHQLVRRRRDAEQDARTISSLYERLDTLYENQRTIAQTLQQALLPQRDPDIPVLEIATRYVAGADGVDIGGDWYSMVPIDDHHVAFVVGDVSGRGVDAAAIMARLRFTVRAYLVEGHTPEVALEMCSRQLEVGRDGHLATVLVGVGDLDTRSITVANAGHLNPLVVSPQKADYVSTTVGRPLGVGPNPYLPTSLTIPAGAAFLAFTDGLIERRGESIDVGLARLARSAIGGGSSPPDLVDRVVRDLADGGSDDDIAILAFRWRDP